MKTNFTLLAVLLLLSGNLFSQFGPADIEDFGNAREINLGYPNTSEGTQLIPTGIDLWEGDDVNTIYYGMVPSNAQNKPVVVFVHGYASNASVWFSGRDNMYWDVYKDGYRSAYVSLTPNKQMWTNGHMLAKMLKKIKARYQAENLVLVGWSKGSVDIDAALVHAGGNLDVSQVFTLSAPHFGTGLAELANSILLELANIIFMQNNDATLCLKRGYMSYFRTLTDNNINNTVTYTTLGAWGNGPLARLSIPQGYLYLAGGSKGSGGNDGVVPYSGSRRPRGKELFGGLKKKYLLGFIPYYEGPDETDLDHFEITRGGKSWKHIKANINHTLQWQSTPIAFNPNASVSSDVQIVSGTGQTSFKVEANAGKVTVVMLTKNPDQATRIMNANHRELKLDNMSSSKISDGTFQQIIQFESTDDSEYIIESTGEFGALIIPENGIEMTLNTGLTDTKLVYQQDETIALSVALDTDKAATISGTMVRSTDLQLKRTNDQPQLLEFTKAGDQYVVKIDQSLPAGIYDITVTAEGNSFRKNVMTSIAVVGDKKSRLQLENINNITAYPNPADGVINIDMHIQQPEAMLKVYNVYGQCVYTYDASVYSGKATITLSEEEHQLKPGVYIVELKQGEEVSTMKFIMK